MRAVLWLQGETDSRALRQKDVAGGGEGWGTRAITTPSEYRDELHKVIRQTRDDFSPNNPVPWIVGQSSIIGGSDVNSTEAKIVRDGQALAVSSAASLGLSQVFAGPNMNTAVTVRRPASELGDEPVHFAGNGLAEASTAWYNALSSPLQNGSIQPVTPYLLGTEPSTLGIDPVNNTVTVAVPSGSRAFWVADNNGAFDVGLPVCEGATVACNSSGRKRAILVNAQGNYVVSQAIDFPYTLVDDSDSPTTDACSGKYTEKQVVGSFYGLSVQLRQLTRNGSPTWIIVTAENNSATDRYFPRGQNLADQFSFDRSCLGGGSTGWGGLTIPDGLTPPSGYVRGMVADGAIYFERTGGTTPNPCAFSVSISPANPSATAGASVQLTAQCSGPCDGVSYSWSGNGLNASGNPVNLTAPGSAGNYTYGLTASKANCANQTASAQLTVTGGGSSASRCAAFTNGAVVAQITGNANARIVVGDNGVCRQAVWGNGWGVVHPDWANNNGLTFLNGFTRADMRYCLTFDGEACNRPASVTPPATAFAVGNTGTPGQADESAARVSSGARAAETAPAPPETGSELLAYPNPTSDVLTVRLDQPLPANPVFTLTDMAGRSYEVGAHLSVLSARRIKLSVRHLTVGQYLLQVGDGVKTRTVRFVKQ